MTIVFCLIASAIIVRYWGPIASHRNKIYNGEIKGKTFTVGSRLYEPAQPDLPIIGSSDDPADK